MDKAHSRREFVDAQSTEPQGVLEALIQIGALYAVEDEIRQLGLTGEVKKLHRLTHSKSHVEAFFAWVDRRLQEHGLRPTTPFTKALNYVRERRLGLEVFLTDPDVPLDTNHLERALRAIPRERSLCTSYSSV
jgi:transposase